VSSLIGTTSCFSYKPLSDTKTKNMGYMKKDVLIDDNDYMLTLRDSDDNQMYGMLRITIPTRCT